MAGSINKFKNLKTISKLTTKTTILHNSAKYSLDNKLGLWLLATTQVNTKFDKQPTKIPNATEKNILMLMVMFSIRFLTCILP
jgi:hypothetical protein